MIVSLYIVMPAFNEEGCIEGVVRDWLPLAEKSGGRLLVVNDGSTDRTPAILDELARREPRLEVVHQGNRGHGEAILEGYRAALARGAEWVFQVDADDQFFVSDFSLLWARKEESPFILGRRKDRRDGLNRKLVSKTLACLIHLSFGERLRDANVPFRLMRADFLASLLPELPGGLFSPNVFLALLARRRGADLLEIPVRHKRRETGNAFFLRVRVIPLCLRSARQLVGLGFAGFGKKVPAQE